MEMEATISKRRKGLLREATDLDSSSTSGCKMAVIVFSPANKPYVYEANQEKEKKAVQDGIGKYGLNEHAGVDELDKNIATLKHFIKILDLKIDHEMKKKDSCTKDDNSEIASSSEEKRSI
ncbi:uncharacterized protein Pyn_20899 [Prunus yedoensis var. nudiflora]|uniref:MADS-box domain-containing protein n=1 Tax=Prunus yedoensis var. nudiflora TaxID=2094558 RepID=A0A314YIK3_PRUYE|nr:uncharacterized protein Pyn_20899 [Prunus yedoensis var. nudiflora]